jgi:transcription termination/antitermination protein NusA
MRSEFVTAINQVCAERNLSQQVVIEAVEAALVSAYKRNFGSSENIRTRLDPSTGRVHVFAEKEIVEAVSDPKIEISLQEAQEIRSNALVGETVSVETTPQDFGRIAAQTAKQVILQRIREAERDVLYDAYADREGELITGTVQSIDHQGVVLNLGKAEASLPRSEQIPGEHVHQNQRVKAYVVEVNKTNRGPQIVVSRTHRHMLRRLLETEVPEIFNGTVEIKQIAREPGSRSKLAVVATQEGVDPVGSCVGMRGVRIQNIVNELSGEKIDVVEWSPDVATFIANALSPAKVMNVTLREEPDGSKTASVVVPDRQLSLAIGKEGQNARLAAKLTGWRIDIKSASEAAEEVLSMASAPATTAPSTLTAEDILAKAEAILRSQPETEEVQFADTLPLTEEEALVLAQEMGEESEPHEAEPVIEPVTELEALEASDKFDIDLEGDEVEVVPSPALLESHEGELVELVAEPEFVDEQEGAIEGTFYGEGEVLYEEGEDAETSKKKKSRKRTLVFDENSGRLVSKKLHKPGRVRDWVELTDDELE